jgi:hypothetical protein
MRFTVKPEGRCPDCRYVRSGVNHLVLCVWNRPRRRPAETQRLLALALYGDTPGEQWERRRLLEERLSAQAKAGMR